MREARKSTSFKHTTRTCISITMKFINEVVNGGVTIILFGMTNPVCVPKKRNFSILFVSVIVRKEGPAPSCSRIVALSFSTL